MGGEAAGAAGGGVGGRDNEAVITYFFPLALLLRWVVASNQTTAIHERPKKP